MKCLEYRDLAELLHDGALAAAAAEEARLHAAGCGNCRSFEEECAVLLAPLAGLPPGPYLPDDPGGFGLPPWAAGPGGALLAILAAVGLTGVAALSDLGPGAGAVFEVADAGGGARDRVEVAAAPAPAAPAAEAAPAAARPLGDGIVSGRIVGDDGAPLAGVRVSAVGGPSTTTDAAGVYTLRGLAAPGSSLLRLEAPGHAPSTFLTPVLDPGVSLLLEEESVGSPVPLALTVLTPDALPAAGARVLGCRTPRGISNDPRNLYERGAGCAGMESEVEAVTGSDGVARFPAVARGTWTFVADLDPFARARPVVVHAGTVRDAVPEPLLLDEAAPLEGIVVDDATGAPVPGAEVLWVRNLDQSRCEDPARNGRTLAGPDGRFRFDRVPALPLRLLAARPGLDLLVAATGVDAGRLRRVELRVPRTAPLTGRCVDAATGAPAAGVVVEVTVTVGGFLRNFSDRTHLRSGPDGRFEVDGIPARASIRVTPVPRGPWTTADARDAADPGPARDATLRVRRAGTIRGTVRDAAGGAVPGREVRAFLRTLPGGFESRVPALVAATRADAEGRFALESVPAGTVLVVAGRVGPFARPGGLADELLRRLAAAEASPVRVELAPGGEVLLDFEPEAMEEPPAAIPPAAFALRGRVVDETGAPVPGARLCVDPGNLSSVFQVPGSSLVRLPSGTPVAVAPDGAFSAVLPTVPADAAARSLPHTLRAFAPGRPVGCAVAALPADDLRVVLAKGATLEGRVVFEDGAPVADALLEAIPEKGAQAGALEPVLPQAETRDDGSFAIDGLTDEPHALLVMRSGLPTRTVRNLRPGGGPQEVRLAPPFDLRLSIRGPDGEAAPGMPVRWVPQDRGEGQTTSRTDAEGRLLLRGLPRVPFRLRIGGPDPGDDAGEFVQAVTPAWRPEEVPPEFALERALGLDGVLEDPAGAPLAGTTVTAVFEREGARLYRVAASGEDGSFRFRGLPAGRVTLRAAARTLVGEAETTAGSTGVRLRLQDATRR